jgi:recombination protein RecA
MTVAKQKKQTKEQKTDSKLLNKQISVLESQFGDNFLKSLTDIKAKPVKGVSSGSLAVDYILSPKVGGMRSGRVLQLWGNPSSGKTTLALGFAANVTARKEHVIFVDAEKTFDPDLATAAGVDDEYFHVLDKEAEESANILYRLLKTGEIGLVIIDSVAAWKPHPKAKADKDIDITRDKIAAASSFLSTTLPRIADLCADNDVLLIAINQVRNKLDMYAGGIKPFGGWVLEHYNAASIRLSANIKTKDGKILDPHTFKPVGQNVKCVCDKSKIDVPLKEVEIPLFLGIGVNPFNEAVELGTKVAGVLTCNGAWYRWADDDSQNLAQGKDKLVQRVYQDTELFLELRSRIKQALGLVYDVEPVNPFLNPDGTPKVVQYREMDV